jgi:hypothetical protein
MDQPVPAYDWLIPNLLERRDRFMLTAAEGAGKSTLLRQWAVQAAAGIHLTTGGPVLPIRVLLLDAENSDGQIRRPLISLLDLAGRERVRGNLHIAPRLWPDLLGADGEWLRQVIGHVQPDLVVGGPLYKLCHDDLADARVVGPLLTYFDGLRDEFGITLMLEHHPNHKPPMVQDGNRPLRPSGSAYLMRWAEFIFSITTNGVFKAERTPREAGRLWPERIVRGGAWPCTAQLPATEPAPGADKLRSAFESVVAALPEEGSEPSQRALAAATGISRYRVACAIKAFASEYDAICTKRDLERREPRGKASR